MTLLDELRNLKTTQPVVTPLDGGEVMLEYVLGERVVLSIRHGDQGWSATAGDPATMWENTPAESWQQTTAALAEMVVELYDATPLGAYLDVAVLIEYFRDHLASLGWLVTLIREMGS